MSEMKRIISVLCISGVIIFFVISDSIGASGVKYTSGILRDPMEIPLDLRIKETGQSPERREVKREVIPPPLSVKGIIWGSKTPMAIINDKVINIGDTIENAEILNISKEGVRFLYEGEEFIINSGQPLIKVNGEEKK